MARPALAIGGIALIVAGAAVGFGWWWPSGSDTEDTVAQRVASVRIDNDSGSVAIRTGDVAVTTVKQHYSFRLGGPPGRSFRVEGSRLVLSGCGWNCDVDYDVVVPRGATADGTADSGGIDLAGLAAADVRSGSGSVTARDIAGPAKVAADSGSVELDGIGGPATVRSGSGSVRGKALRGGADVDADSGSIRLELDAAADVRAHADSGGIDLTVPAGGGYRVEGQTDSGGRSIGVPISPTAPHLLRLDTDSGSVDVTAA